MRPARVDERRLRARLEELRHDAPVAVDARPVQRRPALLVCHVRVRVLGEQKVHDVRVAVRRGEEQRRAALRVRRIHGDALAEVRLDVLQVAVSSRLGVFARE